MFADFADLNQPYNPYKPHNTAGYSKAFKSYSPQGTTRNKGVSVACWTVSFGFEFISL
jgi:hypothetical protein